MHTFLNQKNAGFSMIEVLVSIVILAIGILGAAGLQLASLRSNQFTMQSSIATQLARDYEEITQMLRAANISTSEGTNAFSAVDTNTPSSTPVTDCKGTSVTCTPDELTAYMLKDWRKRVENDLPGGRAVVCRDSTPKDTSGTGTGLYHWSCDNAGDMLMIKIGWAAKSDKTDKVMQSIAADDRPRIVMTIFGNQKDFAD